MDDIIQWLANGRDYLEGVRILDKHTRNRALIRHFQCTTPKFAAAKLETLLNCVRKANAWRG